MKYRIKRMSLLFIAALLIGCSTTEVKEPPFNPEATFKQANDWIKEGKYAEARGLLESIRTKDASRQYAELAKLRIADTYFEEEAYEEAAAEYESFLDLYPFHKYASYAQYNLAMTFFKRITTVDVSFSTAQRALKEFGKLRRNYPRNPYMDVTDDRIKTCQRALAEYEFYVANFYFQKGSYNAAALRYSSLLENFPDSVKDSEALYYLGLSYAKMGQRGKAINTLTTLINKYPTLELSNEAKKQLSSFTYLIIKK